MSFMRGWAKRRYIDLDNDIEKRLTDLIPENMARRGRITIDALLAPVKDILNRQRFPDKPLTERQVELMLTLLSSMDTDKDPGAARVGEREGRTIAPLLDRLSAGFNHGIGRSGHLTAPQPKAAGASLMQQVTNHVALDAIRRLGLENVRAAIVTPLSTGMSIALILGALRRTLGIKEVLYPRIDHASPRRAISFAGLQEIRVSTILEGDAVQVDLAELESRLSKGNEAAVLATTTFFPPRESDPVKDIAKLCAESDTPLVINNAYGVQSETIMHSIRSAIDAGRVDAVVQSSDKNFLTPVGGSIIVSPDKEIIDSTAETYAGRATAAPVVQTLAALLLTGHEEYARLRAEQIENFTYLREQLSSVADSIGQRLLEVENHVACAMTLDGLDAREIGARLYNLRVTGPRVVEKGEEGSSVDNYPHDYIVMNAAIGAKREHIEQATVKLHKEASR
jgi:O-phospho-L-seryl-tRNASec:L-selenocysteinyl-tRNA synthase